MKSSPAARQRNRTNPKPTPPEPIAPQALPPQRRAFFALLLAIVLWVSALLTMYFLTVHSDGDRNPNAEIRNPKQ